MKIKEGKNCLAELVDKPARINASKGCVLVVSAADCEVDTTVGKVIVRGKSISIKERKEK